MPKMLCSPHRRSEPLDPPPGESRDPTAPKGGLRRETVVPKTLVCEMFDDLERQQLIDECERLATENTKLKRGRSFGLLWGSAVACAIHLVAHIVM